MAFNLYKEAGVKTHSIIQDEKLFTNDDIEKNLNFIANTDIFLTQS